MTAHRAPVSARVNLELNMASLKPVGRPRNSASKKQRSDFSSLAHVRDAMMKKLMLSDLDGDDAKKLRFEAYTADEANKSLKNLPAYHAGFMIPYFDLEGRATKFWRYRYLESTKQGFEKLTSKKDMRYAQPGRTLNELYLPPIAGTNWKLLAANPELPLIITEGELKAACATKSGFPTIGLGGVWCFKSNNARMPLLPMFREFNWKDRVVYICYDSDAVTNPQVMTAENALARELTMLGASPFIVRIPFLEKDNKKIGLDDFLVEEGVEALRELLDNAAEWRAAQELFALNQEVVYVRDPGVILRMENLQRISPRAFVDHAYSTRVYYEEQITEKGTRMVERAAAKEWLKWPHRAEVARVTYEPGGDPITRRNELNVWPGWGCDPEEGDITPWKELLDFIFRDKPQDRRWFEQWCAFPLQNPGTKLYSSPVIWGRKHGTGKSLIGYTLGKIYGQNFTEISDQNIHESHNEWAENKQFVMGDEITSGDKRGIADRLKSMITRQLLRLNPKYVPSYTVPDRINYYFTSNHPDSFFLEDDDRRFFIHEVTSSPLPPQFYKNYERWMGKDDEIGPGIPALFAYLLRMDLAGFDPKGHAPVTAAKRDMIDGGRSDLASWVAMLRDDPDTVLRFDNQILKFDLWRAEDLLALYDPSERGKVTANGMARELRRAGFTRPCGTIGCRTSQGQVRLWAIRNEDKYSKTGPNELGIAYDAERGLKPIHKKTKF
jgi:Domain of unknown function (DUF3854)/Family of unknown function (DUF5906)